jgi:hypothetical protein
VISRILICKVADPPWVSVREPVPAKANLQLYALRDRPERSDALSSTDQGCFSVSTVVPDFSEAERSLVAELLHDRYKREVAPQLADSDLLLDPATEELTVCPTLYWSERGAHFVVWKVAQDRYRCQFFYADADQYGTGHVDYTDLRRCVLTLLRVQADHERQSAGISSGATSADVAGKSGDDSYHGPLVI